MTDYAASSADDDADVRLNWDGSVTVTFGGVINHTSTGYGAKHHDDADKAMAYHARIVQRIGQLKQAAER